MKRWVNFIVCRGNPSDISTPTSVAQSTFPGVYETATPLNVSHFGIKDATYDLWLITKKTAHNHREDDGDVVWVAVDKVQRLSRLEGI